MAAALAVCWLLHSALREFSLEPTLFVDNWAWVTDCPDLHAVAMAETLAVTGSLRLAIDWRKSFGWSRDKEGAEWWSLHGSSLLPPGASFRLLSSAKDLGTAMRYRGPRVLGCLHARFQEGHDRLRRLKHLPRPLAVKASLIQSSIWPAVFFGCEGHAVGLERVGELRTAATKSLLGSLSNANPHLALSSISLQLQDPEMFLLSSMLRCLCRALRRDPLLGEEVLRTAVAADGSPYQVWGPATALRAVLHCNCWCLHANARLTGPGNVALCLRYCSSRDIRAALAQAWSYQVRKLVCHRNGLQAVDVPDIQSTVAILRTFNHSQQKTLSRHITGGFQTAAIRAKWSSTESALCPCCGEVEPRKHRFLLCPAFAAIRARHVDAIHALQDLYPHWVYTPFATLPDSVDITNLVFASRPHPSMPRLEAISGADLRRGELVFYTDGTCCHPQLPHARHAAWAVCLDVSASDVEQQQGIQFWASTGQPPPHFEVRSCGLVSGRQTISWAELTAAIQAVRLGMLAGCPPVRVVTDSSYVVRVLTQFAAGLDLSLLHTSANRDLLHLLKEVWFDKVSVTKVRSHQDPAAAGSVELQWQRLGNMAVDMACDVALAGDLAVVKEMVDATAADQQVQRQFLRATFRYLLELHAATQPFLEQQKERRSRGPSDPTDRGEPEAAESFLVQAMVQWTQLRSTDICPLGDGGPAGPCFLIQFLGAGLFLESVEVGSFLDMGTGLWW